MHAGGIFLKKKTGCEDLGWIHLAEDKNRGNEFASCINGVQFTSPAERLSAFSKVPFRSVSSLCWQISLLLLRFVSLVGLRLCRRAEICISGNRNGKYKNIFVFDLAHNSWEAEIKNKR